MTAIPYWVAAIQHLFGDYLVDTIPWALPFSHTKIGLRLGPVPSAYDSLLELAGLSVMLLLLRVSGDWSTLTARVKSNVWMVIPLSTALGLSLLVALDLPVALVHFAFSRRALTAITFGHFVLGLLLTGSFLQGLRAFRASKIG